MDVVRNAKPTVLIGVTAQPGLFSAEVLVDHGATNAERPVILALSNPTEQAASARPRTWRGHRRPRPGRDRQPVRRTSTGRAASLVASQCNNLYIFPGVGLGALVAKAPKVTDEMFLAASRALSAMVTPEQEAKGLLLPPMNDIRAVSRAVAKAVAIEARDAGLGRLLDDDEVRGDHRQGPVGAGVYAISAGEGGGVGPEPVRSKKPEGPTVDCQKPEGLTDERQKQEADKLHRWLSFWLLASGFWLLAPQLGVDRPPTTNAFTTASVSASDSKTVSAPAARRASTP